VRFGPDIAPHGYFSALVFLGTGTIDLHSLVVKGIRGRTMKA
jgi:hypothetical protein